MTYWNGQYGSGDYGIQFHTDNRDYYKIVERACQIVIDLARLTKENERLKEGKPQSEYGASVDSDSENAELPKYSGYEKSGK